MDLKAIAHAIPDYSTFPTVDELNASTHQLVQQYPDLATVRTIGHSRQGTPLELITIGSGLSAALVVGTPHPNEPIGCLTIEFLTRLLCERTDLRNELNGTWHFIKTIDPDGLRRNEGWLKGPYTPLNYFQHFFRPAFADQAEYSFPIDDKAWHFHQTTPETRAWMRAIDEVQPRFQYSLHNGDFGGVFYMVSEPCSALYPLFQEISTWFQLPLDLIGDPAAKTPAHTLGVFPFPSMRDMVDEALAAGITDITTFWPAGINSREYAEHYATFNLVVEVPSWDVAHSCEQSPSDRILRDVLLEAVLTEEEAITWLERDIPLEAILRHTNQSLIRSAFEDHMRITKRRIEGFRQMAAGEETKRQASQAEVIFYTCAIRLYTQRTLALLLRLLEEEQLKGNASSVITHSRDVGLARLEAECSALDKLIPYHHIPIRSRVGVQVCAGLATAASLFA